MRVKKIDSVVDEKKSIWQKFEGIFLPSKNKYKEVENEELNLRFARKHGTKASFADIISKISKKDLTRQVNENLEDLLKSKNTEKCQQNLLTKIKSLEENYNN